MNMSGTLTNTGMITINNGAIGNLPRFPCLVRSSCDPSRLPARDVGRTVERNRAAFFARLGSIDLALIELAKSGQAFFNRFEKRLDADFSDRMRHMLQHRFGDNLVGHGDHAQRRRHRRKLGHHESAGFLGGLPRQGRFR